MNGENQDMKHILSGLSEAMRRGAFARLDGKAYCDCPFPSHERIGQAWRIGYETAHENITGKREAV